MPRYDTVCEECGRKDETFLKAYRERVPCPCGAQADVRLTCQVTRFTPFWHEHLGHTPVYIESREHLQREMQKRGLQLKHSTKVGKRFYDEKGKLRGVGM